MILCSRDQGLWVCLGLVFVGGGWGALGWIRVFSVFRLCIFFLLVALGICIHAVFGQGLLVFEFEKLGLRFSGSGLVDFTLRDQVWGCGLWVWSLVGGQVL